MTLALNGLPRGLLATVRQQLRWVPNALTVARMIAALVILGLFLWAWVAFRLSGWVQAPESYRAFGFYLVVVAMVTDLLDGWTARLLHAVTETGKWLDPLADKIFSIAVGIAVPIEYGWNVYLVVYTPACCFLLWYSMQTLQMRLNRAVTGASWLAKVKTAVLMGAQMLFMGDIAYGEVLPGDGRNLLLLTGLVGFAGAAYLNKLSVAEYRASARAIQPERVSPSTARPR